VSTASDLTQAFAYNPAGQIASATRSGDAYAWAGHANGTQAYAANGLNQLTTAGGQTITHDARGNVTGIGLASYGYSSENLLTAGPNSASLAYDPLGRLYQSSATGIAATRYAYDGLDLIGEYDPRATCCAATSTVRARTSRSSGTKAAAPPTAGS